MYIIPSKYAKVKVFVSNDRRYQLLRVRYLTAIIGAVDDHLITEVPENTAQLLLNTGQFLQTHDKKSIANELSGHFIEMVNVEEPSAILGLCL